MLHANANDSKKLNIVLGAILAEAKRKHANQKRMKGTPPNPELRFIMVSQRDFYTACGFSHLRLSNFADEVQDTLTHTVFVKKYGSWLFTEYEADTWLFIALSPASAPSPTKYLAQRNQLVELEEIPDGDEDESDEDEDGDWYVNPQGEVKKYNPADGWPARNGDQIVITYKHGTYSTQLYGSLALARRAIRVKPAPVSGNEDADEGDC